MDVRLPQASGAAEREAALEMLAGKLATGQVTLGADLGYDARDFVTAARERNVTPHVAQNDRCRRSAIDRRTTRHEGYNISQHKRKRVKKSSGEFSSLPGKPSASWCAETS